MSFKVSKIVQFPQSTLQYIPQDEFDVCPTKGLALPTLGGVLSDTRYIWHAKGPCLEVRDTRTGIKVGAWTFGCILKDSSTKVVCVDEILRPNGRMSLLIVGLDCGISGSMICAFEVFGSKIIRAIQMKEKVTSLHVVDSGYEVLNLPGPLRNFDGIVAVGTEGGNVYLVDICRQICEEALYSLSLRDELYPCQLIVLTLKDVSNIEYYKEQSVREGDHLAIHLNVVLNSLTQHFTLKGPKGEDRIHVNKEEVITSALYYCPQLTSLLVGFNFGAFQLWDLTKLKLIYTSPICEDHLPITRFALQEPADDPRAFCYIWVAYSNAEIYIPGLPFAVMYSLCYESKEYHEGYGFLYQDFQSCSVRFQAELGALEDHRNDTKVKGGYCLGLYPICKMPTSRDLYSHDNMGDTLALCVISWTVWFSQNETQTCMLLFDLNQWYKEQMPEFTKWTDCSNYILKLGVSDLTIMTGRKGGPFLDIKIDQKSLRQFMGVQRLEEHFCPSALSFDLWGVRENDIVLIHSEGLQRALLTQIETAGPLCLIRPNNVYRQVISLGLIPLFMDVSLNTSTSTDIQREMILNVGLEHQLVAWLCKCASEWANGSFSSVGCSLDFLIYWAFQRAIVLKTNCDRYCMPLFDYSHSRLDSNTSILLNSCIRQINSLCTFYSYVMNKLFGYISNPELVLEQHTSLKMVSTYFEVLQWLVNVGLLPECHPSSYPRPNSLDRINAPYPVCELTEYYNEKRAQLRLLSKDSFVSSDSLLFIDNLIDNKCGAEQLQKQWQEDGGSGLYPPPSLQSMLRTYLVEGADISHKHSLVIYVFLDLAMALDQSSYASVITHLIKFPAVFKVSSSIIKITQAFWQLDHGDYTTAMEQLLDPFVLGNDLEPWHHAIAMRALLLQDQYNFALLYMQVRKPPVTDEKDILTAISLFIANGMLDEAFYFKNQHQNKNGEELLMHLFNECNKNDSLHDLLYRCLNTEEEKTFFKYLKSVENATADDLQVIYYLLRSRFVEAFDTHDNSKRKKPENQGLIGQRNATKTDQIVRIFKNLLPDVNKNLVDIVRKERTNLWKEVARPTPLSVFVHNTNEQIQYKSTLIHAALSKAKHTFYDNMKSSKFKDILTEETPFLRTPKATKTRSRQATPVITPKVTEVSETGEELGPSPSKRLKLTPRASTSSPTRNRVSSIHSKMLTPIVKRKTSLEKNQSLLSNSNICTPQSILKVRNLVYNSDDTVDDMLENYEGLARISASPRKSGLGIQPRKSVSRTLRRPQVKFDDAARFSSSLSDQSNKLSLNDTSFEEKSTLSSKDISLMVSSKNSSTSNTDEIFYSPDSSITESSRSREKDSIAVDQCTMIKEITAEAVVKKNNTDSSLEESKDVDLVLPSPRARRSYKRSLGESTPVRSSPRLTRTASLNVVAERDIQKNSAGDTTIDTEMYSANVSKQELDLSDFTQASQRQSPRIVEKVRKRKSLSRKVLEHNTFSKTLPVSSSFSDSIVTKEEMVSKNETITVLEKTMDISEVTTLETEMKISDISTSSSASPFSSHRHSASSSIPRSKILETTCLDSDTSIKSNIFLDSPELPERLKMSNSLLEYIQSRTNKSDNNQPFNDSCDIQKEVIKGSEVLEDLHEEKSKEVEIRKDQLEESDLKASQEDKSEVIQMIYEDLSSGAEDIEEVLSANKQESRSSKVYTELSNCSANTFNELEENIFDITGSKEHSFENIKAQEYLENTSGFTNPNSESFYVPEAEKGFIHDQTKLDASGMSVGSNVSEAEKDSSVADKPQQEIIEISSSSDNEESREHSDTSQSRSFDKSESDAAELNISFERNIHIEEDSRSLVDSQMSRATEEHASESDEEDIPEYNEEGQGGENVGVNEGSNENDSSLEWINNDQQSGDENNENPERDIEQNEALEEELVVEVPEEEMKRLESIMEHPVNIVMEVNEDSVVPSVNINMEVNEDFIAVQDQGLAEVTERQGNEQDEDELHKTEDNIQSEPGRIHICEEQAEKNEEVKTVEEVLAWEKAIEKLQEGRVVLEGDLGQETEGNQEKQQLELSETDPVMDAKEELKKPETKEKETNTSETVLSDKTTSIQEGEIGMKNQCTNTTVFTPECTTPKLETNKVEQSTNTTIHVAETKNDETLLARNLPKDRRVYHPKYGTMKVVTEDQTISSLSSDTTEGEVSKQIIVTAQVHMSSKRKSEMPVTKRVTRRSSVDISQTVEYDILDTLEDPTITNVSSCDIMDEEYQHTIRQTPQKAYVSDILDDSNLMATDNSDEVFTPGRRTRRSQSSASHTPPRLLKTRKSLQLDKHETDQSGTSEDPAQKSVRTLRRTRSASVDEINPKFRKRSLRSNSTDDKPEENVQEVKPKGRGKASSVSQLPVISEEQKEQGKSGRRNKPSSAIEAYATTRRLTRRQASLVKGMETPSSVTAQDDSDVEKALDEDAFDPIKLLDKEAFQGNPDPDEEKVYEPSSPSNSTVSSFNRPAKRTSRSASIASDSSLPPSASQASTPKRRTRRSVGPAECPSPSAGVKTRSRKHSETSSVTSEKSEPLSPPKRAKKKEKEDNSSTTSVATSTRSTRNRTKSTSSVTSDKSTSPKRTRSRRLVSAKSDLPEIVEEKNDETGESSDKQKKRSRKKGSQ